MFQQFYNREAELKSLNEFYDSNGPQFFVVYGRRRVGKTELIKHFIKNRPHIYFLCDDRNDIFNIKELQKQMSSLLSDSLFEKASIGSWYELFSEFIKRNKAKRIIIVIDEFPYLIKANRSVPSIFQKIWDEVISKTDIFLVICGSSISMMEKEVLAYESPLYGRRTGQWNVLPLKIKDLKKFFPGYEFEDIIKAYSVLDGIPLYLSKFDPCKEVETNMTEHIFTKGQFLYEEAEMLLREELREPGNYFMILKSIALGNTKFGDVVNHTGIDKTIVSKYLDNLLRMHVIEKRQPITTRKEKTRDSLYYLKDNYFRFWFQFVYPNRSSIEEGKPIVSQITGQLNRHFSFVFEDVCRQAIVLIRTDFKVGRWWHKDKEIDIVAIDDAKKEILFAECKWQDNVGAERILEELKEKSQFVDWNNNNRKEHFAIFAKSFKKKFEEKNVSLFDLKDVEKILHKNI